MCERDKGSAERALLPVLHAGHESHPLLLRMLEHNQILKHNFRYNHVKRVCCALEACGHTFEITLVPHQVLYPKYCERHRSEYQRQNHLRSLRNKSKANQV